MKLYDLVDLAVNNRDCVVIKVKEGKEFDLISLCCFNGDEKMFCVTKGDHNTYTVFKNNGKNFSWECGSRGFTLVTDRVDKIRFSIFQCIEKDFGIKIKY